MEAAAERSSQTSRTKASKEGLKRAPSLMFRQSLAPATASDDEKALVDIPLSDGRIITFNPLALSPGRIDDELEHGGLENKEKATVKKLVQDEVFRSLTERMERWKAL